MAKVKLADAKVLVLDEGDRLLEMGFKEEIDKIVGHMAKEHETLLFSATVGKETREIAARTLNRNYQTIDCIPKDEVDSHLKIRQSYVICPYHQQLALLLDILQKHGGASSTGGKTIVFFPTASIVQFMTQLFNRIPMMEVMEIHSGLTQNGRVLASEKFRRAKSAILFTTDVSARGVDYPGVTLVLQMGMAVTRDQYIHRSMPTPQPF